MTTPMDDAKALAAIDAILCDCGKATCNEAIQAHTYFADKLAKAEALAEAAEPFSTFVCDDPMKTIGMAIPVLRRAIAAYRNQTP